MQIDQAVNALQDIAKALHDADKTNVILVFATIILAISTIIFGVWDRKRQNDERFERVRPWIVVDGPIPVQSVLKNGGVVLWDLFIHDKEKHTLAQFVRIAMRITNTGIRPAFDLNITTLESDQIIKKSDLENEGESNEHMDFGPNQVAHKNMDIDWEKWVKLSDDKPIFIGIHISYFNGKTRSHSGSVFRMTRGQWVAIDSWYD